MHHQLHAKLRNSKVITHRIAWIVASGIVATAPCTTAEASLIAQFSGTITQVSNNLSDGFVLGETIAGSYLFDETKPNDFGDSSIVGSYPAIQSFEVAYSGGYQVSAQTGDIFVDASAGSSRYTVTSSGSATGAGVSGAEPDFMEILLNDISGSLFSSSDLPLSLDLDETDLGEFDTSEFILFFGAGQGQVTSEITSFVIVPEPASLALLGFGGLMLLCRPIGRYRSALGLAESLSRHP
ncbi:MAG: PEP-CTERM sorting domain-containing protein [Planctomycetota bacterium]